MPTTREHVGRYTLSRFTNGKHTPVQILIPARVSRPLLEKGYKSVDLYITDEWLLYVPSLEEVDRKHATDVDLPFA